MPRLAPPRQFLRNCRRVGSQPKVADSTGAELTGSQLLVRTLIMRRLLLREVLSPDEKYVGLILPPSAAGVIANIALPLMNRIGVNLNYTAASAVVNNCIEQCGIRHVLTSRKLMERLKLDLKAEIVYLDDFKEKVTLADKLIGTLQSKLPIGMLERHLGVNNLQPDDLLTIIFTSGSTGDPKGVMLSQDNVAAQIESIDDAVHLRDDDVAIGVLPFFHSYGYTATMWTVLALAPKGVYHFDPRDAQQIGKLCGKHKVTVFMATPTFLRIYMRRVQPEDFRSLDVVFASAEKLPKDLSDAFEAKFGMRPYEAYGCTEMSPLVAVNVPPSRARNKTIPSAREGTVGKPILNVKAKIVDLESESTTGEPQALAPGEPGLLLVTGPNVMKGYFKRPDLTEPVMRDGWYVTGDVAKLDADGFIQITDRQSRFSKIGGEMVPHIKIEEAIQRALAAEDGTLYAVVTAIPDSFRGERLVVMHIALTKTPEELCRDLATAGLPNIWIPSPDSFCQVDEIPVLGSGKLDLRAIKDLALKKFAADSKS
jgi:acyl-[acyl-carrier-protein]-phospholipid O-acyltransferase/long-chain-fatty-acid--[acyl-carrier-protein] ligase